MVKDFFKKNVSIATFLVVGLIAITSCIRNDNGKSSDLKLVKTAHVKQIPVIMQKHFPGVIEENEEVNLAFRVAGPIKTIHVKEGDFVKKGQLVAEMDTRH